ncbi:MAG: bifunctional ornithine acetyltransferase/N-acetylglutamate synthase [Aquificaceae bacterium]|nr:MAG: bifunctional ornithine acetyltransferase/N-acetylglutamate synthase [Aquificaceae bacterium]
MPVNLQAPKSLLPVKGVTLSAVTANIRYKNRNDLVLINLSEGGSAAGVFTRNKFCAAPVTLCRQHLSENTSPRYLLINAGNANAGTGEKGLHNAQQTCAMLADLNDLHPNDILPFSTGVIGEQLPLEPFEESLPQAVEQLAEDNWILAAEGIMTTDTVAKGVSEQIEIDGKTVTVTGIAKGSGMIEPNMATLLAYVACDADVEAELLQQVLNEAVADSFNAITVDADTSTNDSLVLLASGQAGVTITENNRAAFQQVINKVCQQLAQAIIRDAEGATKFVTIEVESAPDREYAREIAYTVARSPLVKTALFASDPNWGRLLMAIGRSNVDDLDVSKLSLWLGDTQLLASGEPLESYTEEQGQIEMNQEEITIRIALNAGNTAARIWTSDLSHEYVTINAEYRS